MAKRLRRWRLSWSALVIAILMSVGIGFLLYPTAANWIYQYNQSKIIKNLQQEVKNAHPPLEEQLEVARRYNKALTFGAKVESDHRIPQGFGVNTDGTLDYNTILSLDSDGTMGRIRVPAADVDLPIYHGTSDEVLLKGIGHLEGTSLPVGGIGTHTVVTGHRGLANAAMFTHLDRVKVGDIFTLEIFGEVLVYRVFNIRVVAPDETEALRQDPSRDLATLITCTPLGINSHRILVTGERILPTPQEEVEQAGKESELPHFPWWLVAMAVTVVLAVIFVWRSGYPPKKSRKAQRLAAARDDESDSSTDPPTTDGNTGESSADTSPNQPGANQLSPDQPADGPSPSKP